MTKRRWMVCPGNTARVAGMSVAYPWPDLGVHRGRCSGTRHRNRFAAWCQDLESVIPDGNQEGVSRAPDRAEPVGDWDVERDLRIIHAGGIEHELL